MTFFPEIPFVTESFQLVLAINTKEFWIPVWDTTPKRSKIHPCYLSAADVPPLLHSVTGRH